MNKLYQDGNPPLPKLFRVTLMPPKESLTGGSENSPWEKREYVIVRADDPGAASAKAEAFFYAGDKELNAIEVSVCGEGTENPDIFRASGY